mgnify:FL=1
MKLSPEFKEFLNLLNQNNVEYLIIGGYAVGYHGYPRYTGDIDIFIGIEDKNIENVLYALKEFGFDVLCLSENLFSKKGNIVRMGFQPNRIKILNKISGVGFNEAYDSKNTVFIDGIKVDLISLENLKINKKSSGRHKDLDDLEHLP